MFVQLHKCNIATWDDYWAVTLQLCLVEDCKQLNSIKGYTPNQKLACFVLYLKIINTFLEKDNIRLGIL